MADNMSIFAIAAMYAAWLCDSAVKAVKKMFRRDKNNTDKETL